MQQYSQHVIKNTTQIITSYPFSHILLPNFFQDAFYNELCDAFRYKKNQGLFEDFQAEQFSHLSNFDVYCWTLPPHSQEPFSFFYSTFWRDYIAKLFAIHLTDDVLVQLHHHQIDSNSCYVHSDFTEVAFSDNSLAHGINPWYFQQDYFVRKSSHLDNHIKKRVRAIAIIYYLDNEWQAGDGGETALFADKQNEIPALKIAPINNTLLAFAISPESYHQFLSNKKTRNSLNMWFHTTVEETQRRFPQKTPVLFA